MAQTTVNEDFAQAQQYIQCNGRDEFLSRNAKYILETVIKLYNDEKCAYLIAYNKGCFEIGHIHFVCGAKL
jgi:hypothetical protein